VSWLTRRQIRDYLLHSIWPLPVISIVAALITVALVNRAERALGLEMNISPDTAKLIIGTVAGSMLTLIVVSSSALLVTVQLASAQLTPRIVALVYRNNIRKISLALFVFNFSFSVGVLVRIDQSVPLISSYLSAYGFMCNLALFIFFIDGMGKTLRPSTALRIVAREGRKVINSVYPYRLAEHSELPEPIKMPEQPPQRVVLNEDEGVVLAVDLKGLVSLAEASNCLIELVPQVGDFVASGDPLFQIFEDGNQLSDEALLNSVAFGQERTFEQDPMFAFRIIVDIASKALSPAINDPTTGVLAIDQIHHLLRDIGHRDLAEGIEKDRAGRVRVVYRTPNWEDFVNLAVTEIRQYGATSIQITRRLQALLRNLIDTLPAHRLPPLQEELELLYSTVQRSFSEAHDRAFASVSDLQGVGGRTQIRSKQDRQFSVIAQTSAGPK
jgi:uncharacterized membrane protein